MDLISYTLKDFVLNESFQKWILEPDEKANVFWEDWLSAHPDKMELITQARSVIQSIIESNEKNLTNERDQVWNMITASIHDLDRDASIEINEIESSK